jgi:hypothetical protein
VGCFHLFKKSFFIIFAMKPLFCHLYHKHVQLSPISHRKSLLVKVGYPKEYNIDHAHLAQHILYTLYVTETIHIVIIKDQVVIKKDKVAINKIQDLINIT